jgi:hypothetical protein
VGLAVVGIGCGTGRAAESMTHSYMSSYDVCQGVDTDLEERCSETRMSESSGWAA